MVSNYFKGRDVILHAENGVLGYGHMVTEENEIDQDIFNAAGQYGVRSQHTRDIQFPDFLAVLRGGKLRRELIDPIERSYALTLRISRAVANLFGAHG